MLTRSQKKRAAAKDNFICPPNSNQDLYNFLVPRNDGAVEVKEMITMNHRGETSGCGLQDDDSNSQRTYNNTWLLREKLSDLVDGDTKAGELEPESGPVRSLLDMAAAHNIVSVDPKMLSPVLWRTLPKEMLLQVLARLPVPDITQLRSLSRVWRREMTTVNSDINQACDEASPIMVVGISSTVTTLRAGFLDCEFLVRICDLSTHTLRAQYCWRLRPEDSSINGGQWIEMGAMDGGLVCFVSTWRPSKTNPLCIVVVNLLTRVWRKLPPLQYVYICPPQMMHIQVDSETKAYKVVVIGRNINGHPSVEIYDSSARKWTKATPPFGFIFGLAYTWTFSTIYRVFKGVSPSQSVYDFAKGQLQRCNEKDPSTREELAMAIWKDYKFVLQRNTSNEGRILQPLKGYCITKYRLMPTFAKKWVQERTYLCSPFEDFFKEFHLSMWTLKACEGFLMVFQYSFGRLQGHFWLLDLSTEEWSRYPNCFEGHEYRSSICRAFWNVVP